MKEEYLKYSRNKLNKGMDQDGRETSDEELKALIRDALKINIDTRNKRKSKLDLENALLSTLKEFLGGFIIIGYDIGGNPIILKYAKTPMENEALKSLSIKYLSYNLYEGD